jgi:hypothetical protein
LPENSGIKPVNPKFSFIPTPSALYVGSGNEPITTVELNRAYSKALPPANPFSIPFDNFFSNPLSNEKHVQVTEKNGLWLFDEFRGTPQIFSCGYICGIPALDISISGPGNVCNSAERFTIVNTPTGASPVWAISPNLNYISGQGTDTYTVSAVENGAGWIKATMEGGCGTVIRQQSIYAGALSAGDYSINGPTSTCAFQQVTFHATSLIEATYDWYWPADWTYVSGQYGSMLTLQAPMHSIGAEVGVYMGNACGPTTTPAVIYVSAEECGDTYALSFSPNPARKRLTVELIDEGLTGKQIEKVEIVDGSGATLKVWTGYSRKAELDVYNMPKGFCYARVSVAGVTKTARIIIE